MTQNEPKSARISTNGITLNVLEAGPSDGPLVILLHGFPESAESWQAQIGPLAEAGYRVVAPDQRGYGSSDKPRGVRSYALATLADDVVGLVDALGQNEANLIGHDWGGVVAWEAIGRHPSRFGRAVILNAPHPEVMLRELKANPRQLLKSWYTFFFQIPWLPEKQLARQNFQWLTRAMERSSRPGTFSEADFERYRRNWAAPGALKAMVHWYRAGFRIKHQPFSDPLVQVPTLIVWGEKDAFLGLGLARSSYANCENGRIEWIPSAGHWVQHEEPDRVNGLILGFLAHGEDSRP